MNSSEKAPCIQCSITPGRCSVIEAAAGTGKTHNITNIAARIIMERSDITIDKMVIVTFTRAAAGELKTRINQCLVSLDEIAAQLMENKTVPVNGKTRNALELLELAHNTQGIPFEKIRQRIRLALLNFDRAMIGTIHSFAMRCLSENGFDSRLKFGFALNEGSSSVINELARDFTRSFSYSEQASDLKKHLSHYASAMQDYTRSVMSNPDAEVKWPDDIREVSDINSALSAINKLASSIDTVKNDFAEVIAEKEQAHGIAKKDHALKKEKASELCKRKSEAGATAEDTKLWKEAVAERKAAEDIEKTAKQELEEKKKEFKNALAPLEKELSEYQNGLKKLMLESSLSHVSKEYRRICEEKNFLGHDDLIVRMAEALTEIPAFAAKLQQDFPVGLIDEFQDTNDSQFTIFQKIFVENPRSTFIVVGDPRQAIYRFRNCDINTYLQARKLMEEVRNADVFSMNTNRRSGEKYIKALNDIFKTGSFAMKSMDMPHQNALSGSKVLLTSEGIEVDAPIEAAYNDKMDHKTVSKWCAADIYCLIKEKYRLPATADRAERPVEFGDIAVLTGTWYKAAEIRKELEKCGIPARLMKSQNVFKTLQAQQMALFLEGVLNYNDRDTLLRALITPLGDLTLEMLKDEDEVTARACRMQELNALWHKHSFMSMYNEMFIKFKVCDRLSQKAGGDRDLSNFGTIADILCEEAFAKKLTPGALLRTLQKHIQNADEDKDNYPARPETDQGTVLIDTVFGSKGLSYPVVFLPDLFYTGKTFDRNKVTKFFHSAERLCFAPFMEDEQLETARNEMLQENLRKTYVALTRACYYCRFYCGKSSSCAPTDWLFRNHGISANSSQLYKQLKDTKAELTFPVASLPLEGEPEKKRFDIFSADIFRRPDLLPRLVSQSGFLSFTSITPHASPSSSFAGEKYDEGETEEENTSSAPQTEEKLPETFSLPSGTAFGNAIHATLELCDYDISEEELLPIVRRQLNIHGISGEKHGPATAEMLHLMLNTPIADGYGGSFKLSEIAPEEKKCEFEFLYEFGQKFKTSTLFETANAYFEEQFKLRCPELTEQSSTFDAGFFNGSIDLFFRYNGKFYIIDWKTNKLSHPGLYDNSKLRYAMANSRYYLQYMIYTAALFKYLKERLPGSGSEKELYDKYMGGVRYIFLRGFTGAAERGVFSDRLPYETVKELEGIIG